MTASPRRPWWRRKRTWAAALWLSLPILYLLSAGPAWRYCCYGDMESETYDAVYGPASDIIKRTPFIDLFDDYVMWWQPTDLVGGDDPRIFPRGGNTGFAPTPD